MHLHSLLLFLLSVILQEIPQLLGSLIQHFDSGKIHDSKVVGLMPVEALACDQQDLLFSQKIKGELLIVGDVKLLGIDLGENASGRVPFSNSPAYPR